MNSANHAAAQFEADEVLGLDRDGCILQWDASHRKAYNSGQSLNAFGLHNLREHELARVGVSVDTWTAAVAGHVANATEGVRSPARPENLRGDKDPTDRDAPRQVVAAAQAPELRLPYSLPDGRIVGKVEAIAFTHGGAGNQFTTISGTKYATWWDIRTKNWAEGDIVAFKATTAPLWDNAPPLEQAHGIVKFEVPARSQADGYEIAKLRIERRQFDAVIAALRLLESAMEQGQVRPDDGNLGDILTCAGDHAGLSLTEVVALCDNLLDGRAVEWCAA